ncbi:hypothetical protein ACFQ3L_07455 [Lacticaseibacillus jixianensis]|uniref:Cell-wall binding lipoprotein n=1 Tax=Lacticaseibacillus jixianensis TaxID=2486012 RepID=A0ABW4B9H4_9LACO|nr:hypothetical protein [Lacticaseibacillus jixianensis]
MKKLGALLVGLLLLSGCSAAGINQKAQLQTTTSTLRTQVGIQTKMLTLIDNEAAAFPSTFEKAYAKDPTQDFKAAGPVGVLLTSREQAYKRLEAAQEQIETATTALTKVSSQRSPNLPEAALSNALNSLKLAKLDHKTFDSYYKEMSSAETTFFSTVAQAPDDEAAINAALGRLNEYTSSLSQQAEIIQANLQTVTKDVAALSSAVAKMK